MAGLLSECKLWLTLNFIIFQVKPPPTVKNRNIDPETAPKSANPFVLALAPRPFDVNRPPP